MGFQNSISYKNPRHGAPGSIGTSKSIILAASLQTLFSTRSDTDRAIQPQKIARGLEFRIKEVEGLYYLCSGNKGADMLVCAFVFAYAKTGFYMTRLVDIIYKISIR